jgi:hypothetical protein
MIYADESVVRMTMYVEKGVEQMKVERMEANGLRWQ